MRNTVLIALFCVCFLAFLSPRLAQTQIYTNPGSANYAVISGTSATVIKSAAGVLYGIRSTGIQTQPLTCYDNASAASGTIISAGAAALLGVGGALSIPPVGVNFTNGLTCQVPTAIVGTVIVDYR